MDNDGTVPFDKDIHISNSNTLINDIYPNLNKVIPSLFYFLNYVIFAARNSNIDNLNLAILNCFPSQEYMFYSADSIETQPNVYTDSHHIPVEYLRSINAFGLPPGELHLKCSCPLILL